MTYWRPFTRCWRRRVNLRDLFRSWAIVRTCTALSRVLGLAREIGMAFLFGTSLAKSAFDVAFVVPNLFRRLFGEGALSAAFVPVFAETMKQEGQDRANELAGRAGVLLAAVLTLLVMGGVLIVSVWFATGKGGGRLMAVLPLLRIMLPYMVFICLAALSMAILNTYKHFLVPASTPIVLNLVWIAALVFVCPRFGDTPAKRIYGVAWGILLAGVLQLAIQFPLLLRHGVRPVFSLRWRDPHIRGILLLMGPAALGMGVFQVNFLVDRLLAYAVAEWAAAALTYAERLIYLPLGLFATSLATVLLPTFSHQAADMDTGEIRSTLETAMRSLMLIVVPAAVGLLVLARPIVSVFFVWKNGLFDEMSLVYTTRALRFYAFGLVVFSAHKLLTPAFYAMKDMKTPVRVGLVAVAVNFALNVTFVLSWPVGHKHAGLAFATVISHGLSCVLLGRHLHGRIGSAGWARMFGTTGKALVGAALMGTVVVPVQSQVARALLSRIGAVKLAETASLLAAIAAGIVAYAVPVLFLCREEVRTIRQHQRSRS